MTQIHTKYHKLFGQRLLLDIDGRCASQKTFDQLVDVDYVQTMIRISADLPRYVIQPELMASIHKPSTMKSLEAMILADRGRLPFPQVLVEFQEEAELTNFEGISRKSKVRQFVWLSERNEIPSVHISDGKFAAICWTLIDDEEDCSVVINALAASCSLVTAEQAKKMPDVESVNDEINTGTLVRVVIGPQIRKHKLSDEAQAQLIGKLRHTFSPVNDALCAMVLLLHTKGVEQDRIIVPHKMNKARIGSGKGTIQDHVLVRIGHTYTRTGERIEYNKSGRVMPVHWRAGHIRRQRFGTNLEKSYDLWIDPMLINYEEGDVPKPKTKEITV